VDIWGHATGPRINHKQGLVRLVQRSLGPETQRSGRRYGQSKPTWEGWALAQSALPSRRGYQRQHPHADQPRPRHQNMRYLLLKAKLMAVTNTEYVAFQKTKQGA
jgi:hypothetical protein